MHTLLISRIKHINQYPVLWLVCIVNILVFALFHLKGLSAIELFFMPVRAQDLLTHVWSFWTASFVHYTFVHILTNLCLWIIFAEQVERDSPLKLTLLCLALAFISNITQWWFVSANFGGLSGVVFGLFGFVWIKQKSHSHYYVDPILSILMIGLIVLGFTGLLGKTANFAHLAGLIAGLLFGFISKFLPSARN